MSGIMPDTIKVNHKVTGSTYTAMKWLNALPQVIALDFETTGLGHPSQEQLTHLSVAWSDRDAFVLLIQDRTMEKLIMNWLVSTTRKQIWHNLSFDGKYIMHRTGQFPKDYEDSQVFAWSLMNHADTHKAKSGLKGLMGYAYGDWAVSSDLFTADSMKDPALIKYAAIDACATYKLYHDIRGELDDSTDNIHSPVDDGIL